MRRDITLDPGALGGCPDYPQDLRCIQMTTALARSEHGVLRAGVISERLESRPGILGEQHHSGLAALAEKGHLAATIAVLRVLPPQATYLRHPAARGVEQPQQNGVPVIGLERDDPHYLLFREDSLRKLVPHLGQPEGSPHVIRRISQPMGELQE
jgi:hypothetical protein